MLFVFAAVAALILIVFTNKRTRVRFKLNGSGAAAVVSARILPPIPPLSIRFRFFFDPRKGFLVSVNGKPPKKIKRKKHHGRLNVFPLLKTIFIGADGSVGIEGHPDLSVIFTGITNAVLIEACLALFKTRPELNFIPSFDRSVFDLNVEGIFLINPGRLIIEIIKSKRRP